MIKYEKQLEGDKRMSQYPSGEFWIKDYIEEETKELKKKKEAKAKDENK